MSKILYLQIDLNDGMPDKLCRECTETAKSAYNFKLTLEQSDSTLRGYLFKDQIKDSYLMNIKTEADTEIAFVDADPFFDDDDEDDLVEPDYPEVNDTDEKYKNVENYNNYQETESQEQTQPEEEDAGEDYVDDEFVGESQSPTREKSKKSKSSESLVIDKVEYIKDSEGKYVCQICNKKLCDKKGLNLHVRLHTGEKLKRCNICNRGFIKSDHLKRHLLIHERSISCELCDDSFENRQDFKSHMKDEHNEEIEPEKSKK